MGLRFFAVCFTAFLSWTFISGNESPALGQGIFLGYKECINCHEEITHSWLKTRHARAFESLKKTSQEGLPGCLPCHVTGYDEPGGYVDFEITPELIGVQCEACHGAGKAHIANPGEKSGITARTGEMKCKKCHTPGQDPNFSYGKKSQLVHSR